MRDALGPSGVLRVKTEDGGEVTLLHLAGRDGAVVLVLPANGFHVKCDTTLVSVCGRRHGQPFCKGLVEESMLL